MLIEKTQLQANLTLTEAEIEEKENLISEILKKNTEVVECNLVLTRLYIHKTSLE